MQLKAYQTCSIFAHRMTTFKISIEDGTSSQRTQSSSSSVRTHEKEALQKWQSKRSKSFRVEWPKTVQRYSERESARNRHVIFGTSRMLKLQV